MNLLNNELWTDVADEADAPLRSLFCTQYCKIPATFVGLALLTDGNADALPMLPKLDMLGMLGIESCACAGTENCTATSALNETAAIIHLFFMFSTPNRLCPAYTIHFTGREAMLHC